MAVHTVCPRRFSGGEKVFPEGRSPPLSYGPGDQMISSGVTAGLSQRWQSLAEGGLLVTVDSTVVEGPLANTQKKVKK